MADLPNRRHFLSSTLAGGAALAGLSLAEEKKPTPGAWTLTVIAGKPRERGRQYGERYKGDIRAMIDNEIFKKFIKEKHPTRDDMLRYAGACAKEVKAYSPLIHDEMEGMAEGSGIRLEELVLLTLHEEVSRGGMLPMVDHCTALALGPGEGEKGDTFVGQTWDWMESVRNMANMLHWKRPEGPSLLAYAYPGLWVGAGMNSAGIALVWTSAGKGSPRVGIPSYVLLTHLLYQDTLKGALDEARRAKHAGFFTFVMGDGDGNLANVEGSPKDFAIETGRVRMSRVGHGSRKMTSTPDGKSPPMHARCKLIHQMLDGKKRPASLETMQEAFAMKEVGGGSLDVMVYNTTKREAYLSRGPGHKIAWKKFTI
jgi:hypothetical protein